MNKIGIAKALIEIGSLGFAVLGALHAALSVADDFKPRNFTPLHEGIRHMMNESSIRFSRRINMWRAWLGFNISHGFGVFFFGFVYLILAVHDFSFLIEFKPLVFFGIIASLVYFLLALRYWFYAPAMGTGMGLFCFIVAYLLV